MLKFRAALALKEVDFLRACPRAFYNGAHSWSWFCSLEIPARYSDVQSRTPMWLSGWIESPNHLESVQILSRTGLGWCDWCLTRWIVIWNLLGLISDIFCSFMVDVIFLRRLYGNRRAIQGTFQYFLGLLGLCTAYGPDRKCVECWVPSVPHATCFQRFKSEITI